MSGIEGPPLHPFLLGVHSARQAAVQPPRPQGLHLCGEASCWAVLPGACPLSSGRHLASFYWVTLPAWKSFLPIFTDGEEKAFQGAGLEGMKILSFSSCRPLLPHVAKITATEHMAMGTIVTRN